MFLEAVTAVCHIRYPQVFDFVVSNRDIFFQSVSSAGVLIRCMFCVFVVAVNPPDPIEHYFALLKWRSRVSINFTHARRSTPASVNSGFVTHHRHC